VDERSERWERRFDWVLLTAAVLVIPVVAIEESKQASHFGGSPASRTG
jgi:hypothetical protein